MENSTNKLGAVLSEFRGSASLRDFGEFLGISHAYLSRLETGKDKRTGKKIAPTVDMLFKISSKLEIEPKRFFEMCGYFEDQSKLSVAEPKFASNYDITDKIRDLRFMLESGKKIVYNKTELTNEEINSIMEFITSYNSGDNEPVSYHQVVKDKRKNPKASKKLK